MYNLATLAAFEREKNLKALSYTIGVCLVLFLFFFLKQWQLPVISQPLFEEGIEVNLGNSDEGLGDIAPMIPGQPSASNENNFSSPPQSQQQASEQSITGYDNEADDAPVVNNNPKVVKNNTNNNPVIRPTRNPQPVTNPTPTPPRPKAVYAGGTSTGSGGNGADTYNNVRNQGIAGGNGDQGKINGNPNSDSYTGNGGTGNSGVKIRSGLGGRKFASLPTFEDEFNENAKVAVDITVDEDGKVIAQRINLNGTTTTNNNIRNIALRKARELRMTKGNVEEQTGTIIFDFKVKG